MAITPGFREALTNDIDMSLRAIRIVRGGILNETLRAVAPSPLRKILTEADDLASRAEADLGKVLKVLAKAWPLE